MNDKKKTLLFVDDDPTYIAAQTAFFSARGFRVLTADGSDAALKVLELETPDMILIDLMMEHTDSGFTLARQIRREARFQNTPLVMLSGVASETGTGFFQERESLKKWSHLDDFLDKPVSVHRLLSIIEQRLSNPTGQQ
jgi:two-component system, OmpR family, response regulator